MERIKEILDNINNNLAEQNKRISQLEDKLRSLSTTDETQQLTAKAEDKSLVCENTKVEVVAELEKMSYKKNSDNWWCSEYYYNGYDGPALGSISIKCLAEEWIVVETIGHPYGDCYVRSFNFDMTTDLIDHIKIKK